MFDKDARQLRALLSISAERTTARAGDAGVMLSHQ